MSSLRNRQAIGFPAGYGAQTYSNIYRGGVPGTGSVLRAEGEGET